MHRWPSPPTSPGSLAALGGPPGGLVWPLAGLRQSQLIRPQFCNPCSERPRASRAAAGTAELPVIVPLQPGRSQTPGRPETLGEVRTG